MRVRLHSLQYLGRWTCLLLLSPFAVQSSDDQLPAELQDISQNIIYVNTFGAWHTETEQGNFRVIVLDTSAQAPHSRLYVQWVSTPNSANAEVAQVLSTAAVTEINNPAVYKLSELEVIDSEGTTSVVFSAENLYTQQVQNLQLAPDIPGIYQLSSSNDDIAKSIDVAVSRIPAALEYYARPTF